MRGLTVVFEKIKMDRMEPSVGEGIRGLDLFCNPTNKIALWITSKRGLEKALPTHRRILNFIWERTCAPRSMRAVKTKTTYGGGDKGGGGTHHQIPATTVRIILRAHLLRFSDALSLWEGDTLTARFKTLLAVS